MPGVWSRHPRYALFIGVVLLSTFYLLGPWTPAAYGPPIASMQRVFDSDLPGRIARADGIYNKFLDARQGLIKKFGPEPKDVVMFPPNKDPWPAYTVWDFFLAAYNCPHEVQRIGELGDGGKWVCGLSRVQEKEDCVIYSFGINYESSFEAELLANTQHCQIWGYDFSVKSFGPEIPKAQAWRTHFFPYGLSGTDRYTNDGTAPMYTLDTLMKLNGHTHIDILKIDIEGWEFETLTALLRQYKAEGRPLPFGQLQLEIHIWNKRFEEFLSWWEELEESGLRPFWTEPNIVYQNYNTNVELAEYSFLNIKGDNIFIKDPSSAAHHAGGEDGHEHHH